MSKIVHTTAKGETLADIAYNYFGGVRGYIDSLYDLNLWVSEYPNILPEGLEIVVDLGLKKEGSSIDDRMELW